MSLSIKRYELRKGGTSKKRVAKTVFNFIKKGKFERYLRVRACVTLQIKLLTRIVLSKCLARNNKDEHAITWATLGQGRALASVIHQKKNVVSNCKFLF